MKRIHYSATQYLIKSWSQGFVFFLSKFIVNPEGNERKMLQCLCPEFPRSQFSVEQLKPVLWFVFEVWMRLRTFCLLLKEKKILKLNMYKSSEHHSPRVQTLSTEMKPVSLRSSQLSDISVKKHWMLCLYKMTPFLSSHDFLVVHILPSFWYKYKEKIRFNQQIPSYFTWEII